MKNHLTEQNLKGNIKTLTETDFIGEIKLGKFQKLDRENYSITLFNEKGNIIEKNGFQSFGSNYKCTYEYDNYDNIIQEDIYYSNGKLESESFYKYNDENILIEIISLFNDDDGSLYESSISKYNIKNRSKMVNYLNPDGELCRKIEEEFDSNGIVTEFKAYKSEGILDYKLICINDSNGNEIEKYRIESDGLRYKISTCKYDSLNNLIAKNTLNKDGHLKNNIAYKYDFDNIGNWIKRDLFENDILIMSAEREISYYHNNNIDKLIQFAINDAETYSKKGEAKLFAGDYANSIKEYTKAIEINPNNEEFYSGRGNAQQMLGDFHGALKDYNRAIEINPNSELYYNRGLIKQYLEEYSEAILDYSKSININPNYVYSFSNRGDLKKITGDYIGAIDDYDKAIIIKPKKEILYSNRAAIKFNIGDYLGAVYDYTKAIDINPNNEESYNFRGIAKYNLDLFVDAIQDYDKALEINPDNLDALYNRGKGKFKLGDQYFSLDWFEVELQVDLIIDELLKKDKATQINEILCDLTINQKMSVVFLLLTIIKVLDNKGERDVNILKVLNDYIDILGVTRDNFLAYGMSDKIECHINNLILLSQAQKKFIVTGK